MSPDPTNYTPDRELRSSPDLISLFNGKPQSVNRLRWRPPLPQQVCRTGLYPTSELEAAPTRQVAAPVLRRHTLPYAASIPPLDPRLACEPRMRLSWSSLGPEA
jgi:hypothetical protein